MTMYTNTQGALRQLGTPAWAQRHVMLNSKIWRQKTLNVGKNFGCTFRPPKGHLYTFVHLIETNLPSKAMLPL